MDIKIGSYAIRLEILILMFIVFWIMFGHILCSCSTLSFKEGMQIAGSINFGGSKEGFSGSNAAFKSKFSDSKSPDWIMNPDTWSKPNLTYGKNKQDARVKSILDRKPQPIPLPEGQLAMFSTTEFKPECCPNAYSTGTGCACMTVKQYDYLKNRGGNNVPYSEY